MDKRGLIGLFAFGFIVLMFLLFMFLKSTGFVVVTGYTVADGDFSLSNVVLKKVEFENGNKKLVDDDFHIYDSLACTASYSGSNATNLSIGFYSSQNSTSNPNQFYSDIFVNSFGDVACLQDANGKACIAYYNISNYVSGDWKCFATWNSTSVVSDQVRISDPLEMINRAPILLKNIPNINLSLSGDYKDDSEEIDLGDYFQDLERSSLKYGAVGQKYLVIAVDENGDVSFTNPSGYEGMEYVRFRAHDGVDGTFSNNFSIRVGEGFIDVLDVCNSVWDCNLGPCINGQQRCIYYDKNNCGHDEGKPNDLVQSCQASVGADSGDGSKQPLQLTGTLEIKKSIFSGDKKTLLFVGLVVLVLFVIGFGCYLLFRKKESTELMSPVREAVVKQGGVQQTGQVVNLSDLYKYIEKALQRGQQLQKIKQDLINVGWQQRDVDAGFNYINLKRFVADKLNAGFSKDKVIESLKSKGWKRDIIEAIFRDLGK